MELIYLWVKEYKNIRKQGFNFSGRYRCEYDDVKNELTINENKEYVHIFPDNINVTAIVGKNGSGKSTLIEVITRHNFAHKQPHFFIFLEKGHLKTYGVSLDSKRVVSIKDCVDKAKFATKILTDIESKDEDSHEKFLEIILYTNQLNNFRDIKPIIAHKHHTKIINISLPVLLNNTKPITKDNKHMFLDKSNNLYSIFQTYKIEQIDKVVKMLNSSQLIIDFSLPEHIYICNEFPDGLLKKITINGLELLRRLLNDKSSFDCELKINIILIFLIRLSNEASESTGLLSGYIKILESSNIQNSDIFYSLSKNYFLEKKVAHSEAFFLNADKLISSLDDIAEAGIPKNKHFIKIPVKDYTKFKFFDIYRQIVDGGYDYFLDISLEKDISSGEEAFIYQFANFFSLDIDSLKFDNIIVIIDEGELAFHPAWQRKYILYLVNFFSKNFSKKIHIMLTSHSPFILSDIPSQNIIFLDKNENENCIVIDGLKEKKQTFGANIHTLLSDSFFMEDGLMGEYAKSKINELIDYLNGKESPIEDNDTAQKYIHIIGEPILKKQLQRMLDSKRLSKIDEIDMLKAQMSEIQQKIKKLEGGK